MYDYFQNDLELDHRSALYEKLWQNYNFILDQAWKTIRPILSEYDTFGLDERTELFRWVLTQIPLKDWPVQLEKTLFVKEANALEQIDYSAYEYFIPEDLWGEHYNPDRQKDYEELRRLCQENQNRPLFEYLKEYEKKWVKDSL